MTYIVVLVLIILAFPAGFASILNKFIDENSLCLASNSLDTTNTGILSYAADIFQKTVEGEMSTFNCTSTEFPQLFHRCSLSGSFCPVLKQNLLSFLSKTNWKIGPNICHFFNKIKTSKSLIRPKIYVLGGSVTRGVSMSGCCCNLDPNCPPKNKNSTRICVGTPYFAPRHETGSCGWVHFLTSYMRMHYPDVEVVNLAEGGTTSYTIFVSQRKNIFEREIYSHDLIILDYSVNDMGEFRYGNRDNIEILKDRLVNFVEYGVDGIIRHFLVKGIMPTIVLLESWPRGYMRSHYFHLPEHDEIGYHLAYRKLAEHYNLILWSYRDAVLDNFVDQHQSHFKDYIRLEVNHIPEYDLEHSPWHAQLFGADLITGALVTHMKACDEGKRVRQRTSSHSRMFQNITLLIKQ